MLPKSIPIVQTADRIVSQLQRNIVPVVEEIMQASIVTGTLLKNISLISGTSTISHGLGRALQGWSIVRLRANAQVYDVQDSNPNPNLTLQLVSNAAVTVDLWVF